MHNVVDLKSNRHRKVCKTLHMFKYKRLGGLCVRNAEQYIKETVSSNKTRGVI